MSYLVAQICLNGHIITDAFNSSGKEKAEKFCRKCGEKTLTECPNCKTNILGRWVRSWQSTGDVRPLTKIPYFCHECGTPYPWTESKKSEAEKLIAELPDLNLEEKDELIKSIPDIMSNTPNTEMSANRFINALKKAPKAIQAALYKLLVEIASETAAKFMKGV